MKKILVTVSFSENSKIALHNAYLIATQYGASLSLLHCYPVQEYNREYSFGKKEYDTGIRRMLADFYNECIENGDNHHFKLITYPGSVSDIVSKISAQYDLLVMNRKTGFQTRSNRNFSDKLLYISTKSLCPVLITSTNKEGFSFQRVSRIWHIQRNETERDFVHDEMDKLGIDTNMVATKSLLQKNFDSAFWRNIVAYTETHDKTLLKDISRSSIEEQIDLLILINHLKGMFEMFIKGDAFQIISQFDIPIMIFQSKK